MRPVFRLTVASFGLACATAYAVSPSQEECEAAGGSFDRVNGQVICVFEENVGNAPPHSSAQTTESETTGQGNTDNKTETECSGPPGQCK